MVGSTAIVSAYAYGKFLGKLNVTFDDAGNLIEAKGEPLIMDGEVVEHEATVARIAELAKPLDEIRNKVVAQAATGIDGDRANCRYKECQMGNLVADAMLDRVKDQGIQIALMNGGGIRASIDDGEVTMGEIYTVLPFQNTLATFQLTGAQIKDALENALAQYDDAEKDGRFAQISGMKYTAVTGNSAGERVTEVMVMVDGGYQPLEMDRVYGVVSNNFLRAGGDGYAMFKQATNAYDFGPDLAEVLVDYMVKSGPYTPYIDGRISLN